MGEQKKKLVFLVTELGYFCSHRLPLALAAQEAGFEVTVVANCQKRPALSRFEPQLKGLHLYHLPFDRSRLNPFREAKTLWQLWKAYRRIRPDIVHQVAFKPIVYGTLCARLLGIPRIVNALGGLGYLFTHQSVKSAVIKPFIALAFRILLNHRRCVLILQNSDDVELMAPLVGRHTIRLIRGAGVNLDQFHPVEEPSPPLKAVMASRLLWSKGIGELVEAARLLKGEGVSLEVQVAGDPDPHNPASVPPETMAAWKKENVVTWLGACTDIAALYNQAHIAVLPSYYREGIPKALLEAAACGKPIVTTDAPGCREVVVSGENGLLVPPRDAVALAKALKTLVDYPDLRIRMGKLSRRKAEEEFAEEKVISQTLLIYTQA